MSMFKRFVWLLAALVTVLTFTSPAVASAQSAPPTSAVHTYGAHANFSRYSGAGYHVHHGRNGESDVNTCSTRQKANHASCFARVVVKPAASSASTTGPTADNTSACPASDVNAPSTVITGGNAGYDPCYLQSAYNVAATAESNGGKGQIVSIVDYSVDANIASDLAAYRAEFGLPACPTGTVSPANTGCVFQQVAQSGAPKSGTSGWDVEISLDVDTVSAICPNCQILLIEASSTSISSLGSGDNTAVADGAIAVSNSYGGSESSSEASSATSYFQHPGVAITVSTGDSPAAIEFPATAPDVTAVGGTSLLQYSDQGTRSSNASETVWNGTCSGGTACGTGAGCSAYDAAAPWQSTFLTNAGGTSVCSRRVTADVSADADPATGLWIYDSLTAGGWTIVGGTSLASPLTAALYGLANNATGSSVYPASDLYADAASFYHVTSGNVGSCGNYLCNAADAINGFSGPGGVGTPGGNGALAAFDFNSPVAPVAPSTPTVTATTPTSATLTWPAVTGAASYNIYSGPSAGALALLASGVSSPTYTATGLAPSSTYYFAVSAANRAGTSAQSPAVSATTTAAGPPSAPTGLVATPGTGSIALSWTAPVSNGGSPITGYTVYYSTTAGAELTGSSVATTATTATISALTTGTTYYFEVVATNVLGSSSPSTEISATPVGVPSAPTLAAIAAGTAGSGKVTLTWTAPTSNGGSALTGYVVYDGTTSPPTTKLGTVSATTTSASVSGLTPGTLYYFDVVATNANGSSPASNIQSVKPAVSAPGAPGSVTAKASGTTVAVSWRASTGTGPITYSVKVSTSSSMSNATTYSAGSATTYSVTGLSTATTYYFQVVATNAGGSTTSSTVSSKG